MNRGARKKCRMAVSRYYRRKLKLGGFARVKYGVSRYGMFIMSVLGYVPEMSSREFKRRFPPGARGILAACDGLVDDSALTDRELREKRAKAKAYGRKVHGRKKRKLQPSDYAWQLKEAGLKYFTEVRAGYNVAKAGHKTRGNERKDAETASALEFWKARTDQFERQKANAKMRRMRKELGLDVRAAKDGKSVRRCKPRSVSMRVSKPLYEAIVFGECVSFNRREIPGHERDFLPDVKGTPVQVVSVRTPGNDPDYGWLSFWIDGLERLYRESDKAWYWKITLGDRVDDELMR